MITPDITFRSNTNPASVLGSLAFVFSTLGSNFLPVLYGANSLPVKFRVYNNYAKNSGIANAFNVNVTTFDGVGVYTASTPPVAQSWLRVQETGFGESTTAPGLYTQFAGSDTAVGGNTSVYFAEVGSDGLYDGLLRAGASNSGVGFLEFEAYAQVPPDAAMATWNFAIDVNYEWVP
jgi:hypothetical protein